MTERRIAIIDLGSNTCRLVIFAYTPRSSFKLIDQVSERVRIGEGMFKDNRLQPEPMARTIQLLRMFRAVCDASSIQRVIAVATSAVREAINRDEFLTSIRREAGLRLHILSGDEEAYYGYLGVINSLAFKNGFIADLGGGSLEIVRVQNRLPVATASLPLGAVRLTEEFLKSDPPKTSQIKNLENHIRAQFGRLPWLKANAQDQVVMLGGTIRTLAKVDQKRRAYPLDRFHGYILARDVIFDLSKEFLGKSLKERQKMKGLGTERADIIPAGTLVIWHFLKQLGAETITVSGQGLREGLFYEEFLRDVKILNHKPGSSAPRAKNQTTIKLPAHVARVPLIPDVRAFGIADIGDLYNIDWAHANHVCQLALALFDQLHSLHHYGQAEREVLGAAAILHDVGATVDYYRHHHHSAYLIENADLPGFTHREIALITLLVLWHRRGNPTLEPYESILPASEMARVVRLCALLRMAEDLERGRRQAIRSVRCRIKRHLIQIQAQAHGAAEAELWAANRNGGIFESAFARDVRVTAVPARREPAQAKTKLSGDLFERAYKLGIELGRES